MKKHTQEYFDQTSPFDDFKDNYNGCRIKTIAIYDFSYRLIKFFQFSVCNLT